MSVVEKIAKIIEGTSMDADYFGCEDEAKQILQLIKDKLPKEQNNEVRATGTRYYERKGEIIGYNNYRQKVIKLLEVKR